MGKLKIPQSQLADVENYDVLRVWLEKHSAMRVWSQALESTDPERKANPARVECWTVRGGGLVLLMLQPNEAGWDVYTAAPSPLALESLVDAELRLGLSVWRAQATPPGEALSAEYMAYDESDPEKKCICADCGKWHRSMGTCTCGSLRVVLSAMIVPSVIAQHGPGWYPACFPSAR